jgi:hypothetical protein
MIALIKMNVFCAVCLLLLACEINKEHIIQSDACLSVKNKYIFSIVDTLKKYQETDSITFWTDSTILFIGKKNNCRFGIYFGNTDYWTFYHQIDDNWVKTDTMNYSINFAHFEYKDVNGDNFEDILFCELYGMAENKYSNVCLFDPQKKIFKHNPYYDLMNVTYEKNGNFIKSWWYAGTTFCQEKKKYKIIKDSLSLEIGILYCPDEDNPSQKTTVQFFNNLGIIKTIIGHPDTLSIFFQKSLWDSSEE